MLKTRRFGYDGKGQCVLRTESDVESAWRLLGGRPLILEQFMPFDRELSILAVRSILGEIIFYPLIENMHQVGILRSSRTPAPAVGDPLQARAEVFAAAALNALDYVGVLAIEFFAVGRQLLANEMAPRVHNSGHWTIEGAETSQFENHLRAGLGWPLGSSAAVGQSLMWNLIGDVPAPTDALAVPGAHLHLYGKAARPGRKLGHLTVHAPDAETLNHRTARLNIADWATDADGSKPHR
jgi:5-(carboxyamino)imidazole ribonucleotide synthase